MNMADIIFYLEFLAKLIGGVCILATVIVRVTPSKKDDKFVSNFNSKYQKFIAFLPTLGINPNTKKMIEVIEEQKLNEGA